MNYQINEKVLKDLVQSQIISNEQSQKIWSFLIDRNENRPSFNGLHLAYYFGALICILAMTWLMNEGWEQFGGAGLATISFLYIIAFTIAGRNLWRQKNLQIPGGLVLTISVCMVPLFVYGLQRWTGFWQGDVPLFYNDYHQWIRSSWVLMSLATVAVGGVYLSRFAFPFLTMPIAVALYYISMDLVPLIHQSADLTWELRRLYSMWFGLGMIVFAYLMDRKYEKDYAFWLYLFGLIAFWGGLTSMRSESELNKFIYFLINLCLIYSALFLRRTVFVVFGAFGVCVYLFHLAHKVFQDSLLFPIALVLCGLGIIYLGVQYQKNKNEIEARFNARIPHWLSSLRPKERS